MPRQNRVTPFGEIVARPDRGAWMGNRGGCLHDAEGRLTGARWRSRAWIYCRLEFKGRRRTIMAPGRYTELFFLDEPTALAAGHRPCGECQHARLAEFRAAWLAGNPEVGLATDCLVGEIDRVLHAERLSRTGGVGWRATIRQLPGGAMVCLDRAPAVAWLYWAGRLERWTPGGYGEALEMSGEQEVAVLTSPSTVRALAAGFQISRHGG